MAIQWFPGHMHKARKNIAEAIPQVDLVIEVLDARIPYSSENPLVDQLRRDRPCLKILNKCDLADPEITERWQREMETEAGVRALPLRSDQPERSSAIGDLARQMFPGKDAGHKPIHAMIMGIPNVGKSTLINILAGKTIAKTGNEPAVTKSQQRINLRNGIVLSDTPGILWPKVENELSGYRLATTGAIKDTAMEYEDVAFFAADFLIKAYPQRLQERYGLDTVPGTEIEFLEIVGRKRGCLRGGGQVDLNRISKILLTEIRDGSLGPLSFETPEMIAEEEIEVARQRQIREEKRAQRQSQRKNKKK